MRDWKRICAIANAIADRLCVDRPGDWRVQNEVYRAINNFNKAKKKLTDSRKEALTTLVLSNLRDNFFCGYDLSFARTLPTDQIRTALHEALFAPTEI